MQPVIAMRAGRSIALLALVLGAALVPPATAAADNCAGGATLSLSNRHPVQMRAVRFSASSSNLAASDVSFYDFDYGDGSDDATTTPSAVHAYQNPGTYLATVKIVTTCDTVVTSPAYHVVVGDGLPPTVTISYPKANALTHFGAAGLLLQGRVSDPSGVRRVELAIQLLSVLRAATVAAAAPKQPGCYWYDGRVKLRVRGCASPLFFAARVAGTHWSFRMNPHSQIPPGVYVVRVRATDRRGNTTTIFSAKLGDILGFKLVA